jgi:hypothetical protein
MTYYDNRVTAAGTNTDHLGQNVPESSVSTLTTLPAETIRKAQLTVCERCPDATTILDMLGIGR